MVNKTIFVTGSAGFIGSNLVLKLLKENEDIFEYPRSTGNCQNKKMTV